MFGGNKAVLQGIVKQAAKEAKVINKSDVVNKISEIQKAGQNMAQKPNYGKVNVVPTKQEQWEQGLKEQWKQKQLEKIKEKQIPKKETLSSESGYDKWKQTNEGTKQDYINSMTKLAKPE
jgi:hypothetical protein